MDRNGVSSQVMIVLGYLCDMTKAEVVEHVDESGSSVPEKDYLEIESRSVVMRIKFDVLDILERAGYVVLPGGDDHDHISVTESGRYHFKKWIKAIAKKKGQICP